MHLIQDHTLTLNPFPCGRSLINHTHAFSHRSHNGYLLELLLTWYKKAHLLLPNYTTSFTSSFNCLHQRKHNVIPAAATIPSKCIKFCETVQKHLETVQVAVVPNESISFISLWRDSFTDEGYNLGQVAMFTFIKTRWNVSPCWNATCDQSKEYEKSESRTRKFSTKWQVGRPCLKSDKKKGMICEWFVANKQTLIAQNVF